MPLSFLKSQFSKISLFLQKHKFHYVIYGLGLCHISYIFFRIIRLFYKSLLRPGKSLTHRYGHNSWVLLTGKIDGIGKDFCCEFANQGFNICIISKNNYKLVKVSNEIRALHPLIQTRIVTANFDDALNNEFFKRIDAYIKDLDISILINNVGLSKTCTPFQDSTDDDLKEMLVINCFPIVFMTKRVLPKMLLRKCNSAIINLSSQEWHFPGRSPLYCASRAFEDMFSESLTNEFHEKIDVLTYTPLYLSNYQNKFNKGKFWNIEPRKAVGACLKEIGYERKTYGHWKHKLMARWMEMLNAKGRYTYTNKITMKA